MATERHLRNAPIREAVLDIRIPETEAVAPEGLRESLASMGRFSELQEIRRGSIHVRIPQVGLAEARSEGGDAFGFRATTQDGLFVVQFRKDGFTFSRLPPYPDWAEFVAPAREYAESFLRTTTPPYVERLALRYINHLRLPYPSELSEYIVGLPQVPETLPQFMSNLLTRFTLHDPRTDFSANVTLGVLDDLDPELIGFILDIDAFRTAEYPPDFGSFMGTFEQLRDFKNAVFFAMITERTVERYA